MLQMCKVNIETYEFCLSFSDTQQTAYQKLFYLGIDSDTLQISLLLFWSFCSDGLLFYAQSPWVQCKSNVEHKKRFNHSQQHTKLSFLLSCTKHKCSWRLFRRILAAKWRNFIWRRRIGCHLLAFFYQLLIFIIYD